MFLMEKSLLGGGVSMLQSDTIYRAYIHDRFNLNLEIKGSARVDEFSIKRDALTRANSSFSLDKIPNSTNEGDILTLMDNYGTTLYQGVIIRIEANVVETSQMLSIFNDQFKYDVVNKASIEQTIADHITSKLAINTDPLISEVFNKFNVTYVPLNTSQLPTRAGDYTHNLEEFMYSIFDNYDVQLFFNIPFTASAPTLEVRKVTKEKIKLIDNTVYLPGFFPVTEIYETNKLEVYHTEEFAYAYRGTWFGSKNGITTDPNELTRLSKIKTNIAFSDDPIPIILAQNLRTNMFNHKVEIDFILNNKLYDFWNFELGQSFEVWYNGDFYDTILTGYEMEKIIDNNVSNVKLIFGKVRTKASQRWNI